MLAYNRGLSSGVWSADVGSCVCQAQLSSIGKGGSFSARSSCWLCPSQFVGAGLLSPSIFTWLSSVCTFGSKSLRCPCPSSSTCHPLSYRNPGHSHPGSLIYTCRTNVLVSQLPVMMTALSGIAHLLGTRPPLDHGCRGFGLWSFGFVV